MRFTKKNKKLFYTAETAKKELENYRYLKRQKNLITIETQILNSSS